jgi:hypothetical protein
MVAAARKRLLAVSRTSNSREGPREADHIAWHWNGGHVAGGE